MKGVKVRPVTARLVHTYVPADLLAMTRRKVSVKVRYRGGGIKVQVPIGGGEAMELTLCPETLKLVFDPQQNWAQRLEFRCEAEVPLPDGQQHRSPCRVRLFEDGTGSITWKAVPQQT